MKYYVITRAKTGMHCFYINPRDLKSLTSEKRLICTIGNVKFHCALQKDKLDQYYVYIGKQKLKQLSVVEGMVVKPTFRKDRSEYQFDFPEEFKEVLRTDDEAAKIFSELSGGTQRALIYLVQRLKTSDKRIERSMMIVQNLRNGITSPRLINKTRK